MIPHTARFSSTDGALDALATIPHQEVRSCLTMIGTNRPEATGTLQTSSLNLARVGRITTPPNLSTTSTTTGEQPPKQPLPRARLVRPKG